VSVRASTAVWDYSAAPNNTVLIVALVLADHADYDGKVWLALGSVAAQARVARSTVQEAIRVLETLGELERIRQGGKGPGDVTTYRLTLVDKFRKRYRQPDTNKVPKRYRKGTGLSVPIRRDVDTKTTRARQSGTTDFPPALPADEHRARVNELRADRERARHGVLLTPLFALEDPPA
jgi:hypothetical protein